MINFPIVPIGTGQAIGRIGTGRAAGMALVTQIVNLVVAISAFGTEPLLIDLKATVAEYAPAREKEGVLARDHSTVRTC